MQFRVGFGFDVHQLVEGRPMILGGVQIPHTSGPIGHSDADVLLHAICDALLGAAALGDIGQHFPDTSADFKNIDSKILLSRTVALLEKEGYVCGNIDATLVLEQPKIAPHVPEMRRTIAALLKVEIGAVSIKATTNEMLGFIGRQEGVTAHAVALIYQKAP
ncbi:MAG: 2-C-methyl-D-erythritol 2,4-cyclodiphosphate synthase [Flavobacteriales bacterium]|jgi:2-C-methyl-D-erythritol 2,4-cyclodiphosphate synthase|nr:2-C-methyl-D-erythritol 2,4-cyclodiphosphate synthase [Flavobacteriales bacterium]